MDLKQVLIPFILFFSFSLYGQVTIRGKVIDASTNDPMVGASVFSPNTKEGTTSDIDGLFELNTSDSILQINYLGYEPNIKSVDSSFLLIKLNRGVFLPEAIIQISALDTKAKHEIYPGVSYLNKRAIQLDNETSIAPTLNLIPGVFMHSGALNTNRITIRGIGNRNLFGTAKIKAYLEGIPLTNGSGETTIEDIDLSTLNAITVYKGPSSSIYGSGLGGMISLQIPDFMYKDGNKVTLSSTGGSYGLARNVLNFSRSNYDKSYFNLNLNSTQSDGYRDNNNYLRQTFTGFGRFNINERETVNLIFNYTWLRAEIPSSLDSMDYVNDPKQAAFIWDRANGREITEKVLAGVSYAAALGKHFRQVSSFNGTIRSTYEVRPFNILRENTYALGGRTEWIYDHGKMGSLISNFEFHLGAEIFDEAYNWQTYDTDGLGSRDTVLNDLREKRNYRNLFAQAEIIFSPAINLTLGLNRNYTFYEQTDFLQRGTSQSSFRVFPRAWSPFINIGLDLADLLSLDYQLAFSATVSHGFSPPTVEESLQSNGQINSNIQPEQGWNYEIGFKGVIGQQLNYSLNAYSMQIKDLLVARRTGFDQFIGINAGKTQHNGLEASLEYQIDLNEYRFSPFLNYSYSDFTFKEFEDGDFDYSGNQLTGTAPHLITTGIRWTDSKFYGTLIYRFVDEMPMRDDNSVYSDNYQLVNLKCGYQYSFSKKWSIDFFAGINNIFNEKYASMVLINAGSFGGNAPRYYYPGLPRNFYAGVKIGIGNK